MMKIIKDLLIKIINDIDTGNSNLSADECNKVIEYLTEITNKNEKLSKYQACKYLKVSRATFDNYVRAGKIPKGRKQIGLMIDNVINTKPFKVNSGFLGELEIGSGKIKMNLPLVNRALVLSHQDLIELKDMLNE